MHGLDPIQFRNYVIRPTLKLLDPAVPYSLAAENLLLGTAIVESDLRWLKQRGSGPALGVYQVEPATHRDLLENYVHLGREPLRQLLYALATNWSPTQLVTNLAYATAIARLVYRRSPRPLPAENDAAGLAKMHEVVYNTRLGAVGKTPALENLGLFGKVIQGGIFGPDQLV